MRAARWLSKPGTTSGPPSTAGIFFPGAPAGGWIGASENSTRGACYGGRNEIRLTYRLRHAGTAAHVGEVFETERNRFFYPLERDNVYLRGDFDIEAAGILSSTPGFHSLQQARFTVTPPTPKVWKDLTPQGLWFYRATRRSPSL